MTTNRITTAVLLGLLAHAAGCDRLFPAKPLSPRGPVPFAITLAPTQGEDFVGYLAWQRPGAGTVGQRVLTAEFRQFGPDLEMARENGYAAMDQDSATVAHVAAILEQAEGVPDAKCADAPGLPSWPATWIVRFYDRVTPQGPHVAREFTVTTRKLRCVAHAENERLRRPGAPKGPYETEELSTIGLPRTEPAPPKPQLAPAEQRATLLAMLQSEDDGPPLGLLDVSLWFWPADRRMGIWAARYADFGDRAFPRRPLDADVVDLPRGAVRALLAEALADPAVQRGAERARASLPMTVAHGELRVLDRTWGLGGPHYSQPLYIAYLTRDETLQLAGRLQRALAGAGERRGARDLAIGAALLRARGGG